MTVSPEMRRLLPARIWIRTVHAASVERSQDRKTANRKMTAVAAAMYRPRAIVPGQTAGVASLPASSGDSGVNEPTAMHPPGVGARRQSLPSARHTSWVSPTTQPSLMRPAVREHARADELDMRSCACTSPTVPLCVPE